MALERKKDLVLWKHFKEGDARAYEEIYRKNYTALFNYGMQICLDSSITRDSIQNIFIDLWQARQNLTITDNIKFYLFKCLRHKIINAITESKKQLFCDEYPGVFAPSYEKELIESQVQDEKALKLKNAVNNLTKKQREIIFLKFFENLNAENIAEILSININTVYNTISLALKALKEQLIQKTITYSAVLTILLSWVS